MSSKPRHFHVNPPLPGETPEQTNLRLEANLYNLTGVLAAVQMDLQAEKDAHAKTREIIPPPPVLAEEPITLPSPAAVHMTWARRVVAAVKQTLKRSKE